MGRLRTARILLVTLALASLTAILTGTPATAGPTGTFQFQVRCQEGTSAMVDPIKAPGTVSAHRHSFFGNRLVTSTVTPTLLAQNYLYADPVGSGTTCDDGPGTTAAHEDTALYWVPTLVDCVTATGVCSEVPTTADDAYYKCIDFTNAQCSTLGSRPFGEQQVAGAPGCVYGNATSCTSSNYAGSSTGQATGVIYWGCGDGYGGSDALGRGAGTKSKNVVYCGDNSANGGTITGGDGIHVHVIFPDCVSSAGPDPVTHTNPGSYANKNSPAGTCPAGQTMVAALILRSDWAAFKPTSATHRVFVVSDQLSTAGSGLACADPHATPCTYPTVRNNEGISVHGDFMNGWINRQQNVNTDVTVNAANAAPNPAYTDTLGTQTPYRGLQDLMDECIHLLKACAEV